MNAYTPRKRFMRKAWEDLTLSRQCAIMNEWKEQFRCPECGGRLEFVGAAHRTVVLHEPFCSVPAKKFMLAVGTRRMSL